MNTALPSIAEVKTMQRKFHRLIGKSRKSLMGNQGLQMCDDGISRPYWVTAQIDALLHRVNKERAHRGMAPVAKQEILKAERISTGADYHSKYALHLSFMALGME